MRRRKTRIHTKEGGSSEILFSIRSYGSAAMRPRRLWCAGIIGVTFFLFFSLENMGILNDNVVSAYLFSTNMSGVLISFVFCALPYATVFSEDQEHKYVLYKHAI